MNQKYRIDGGLIDRNQPLNFTFNNRKMQGYQGDTLASALLANGQKLVGRSFKYHRARGIYTAGSEEPNALIELGRGAAQEPNTRATVTELYEGLYARSQNHMGSLQFDFLELNDILFSKFFSAGFYYKTFMWPKKFWEKVYEPMIRKSAGLGRLARQPDPDVYDHGFLHCDILIVGSGPAGLGAALTAGRAGARVIIADEDFLLGGRLHTDDAQIDAVPAREWVRSAVGELQSMENVRIMSRTTIYGVFDHGIHGALERKTDHLVDGQGKPRQILWRIYSKASILCAGATERGIAFTHNDRPGIMLSGAVRTYLNRYAVKPGEAVSVFTNNDDGWETARMLLGKGVEVSALIDARVQTTQEISGVRVVKGATISDTKGRYGLRQIILSDGSRIDTDCLAVSGGWSPNVHLTCHHRSRPLWNENIAAFVPGADLPPGQVVAGAANGTMTLGACIQEGCARAKHILEEMNFTVSRKSPPKADDEAFAITPLWHVKGSGKGRAWVDMQNDVTAKDVIQANMEGFRSVEHLKRYTTLGMATDQGKTANLLGLAILAEASERSIEETGTTIFRPPYTPVAIGAFAGRSRGKDFRPFRHTPSHNFAQELGAKFVETGMWLRAQWFAREGEKGWRDSVDREVTMTRDSVGICDVTTLGKIDIQGQDAATFINKIYANGFAKLPVGKVRYGLMLREDGFVYDDGTTARLSETHFVMTTTTANAVVVFRNMEFARQCLFPEMDVHLISTTDAWAQFAVAGPNARKLLQKIVDEKFDISNEAFPFMACGEITVCNGLPARLFRISFSGELAYEIAVPARYGDMMVRALMRAGEKFDAIMYGTEALGVMRIEKGHPAGNELTGQTHASHLGLDKMVSQKKDSIGLVLSRREGLNQPSDWKLMGIKPVNRDDLLQAGGHFFEINAKINMQTDLGWLSSVAYSPSLGHSIGIGFIKDGHNRMGQIIRLYDPVRNRDIKVEVVSAHFIDPEGERLRA